MPPTRRVLPISLPFGQRPRRGRIVVCGANQLAYRLVEELTTRHGESVVAIVPSIGHNRAGDIAELDGVEIIESSRLDVKVFEKADLRTARSLALVADDDVGNLHAALRAQEVSPKLRLVIRMSNANLRYRIHELFADCTALHDASTAAPAFVAAALDRPAPIRLPTRTLITARRRDVPADSVVCALAGTAEPTGPLSLLPNRNRPDDLVLATADGQRERSGPRARTSYRMRQALRRSVRRGLAIAVGVLLGLIVLGIVLRVGVLGDPLGFSLYDTVLTIAGAGDPDRGYSGLEEAIQAVTMIGGVALIPAITAALVDWVVRARLTAAQHSAPVYREGHVIVTGLGDVGERIVRQLDDMGERVVAIESGEDGPGLALCRERGIPVIHGDATRSDVLSQANLHSCRALVPVTSDDVTNLEIALNATATRADLRVVLRLFDADLAARVEEQFGITTSRSVAYLAAPVFAAALVERQVINTIPVGRRVLVIADLPVSAGAQLAGQAVRIGNVAGESRVIALRGTDGEWTWAPALEQRMRAGQRIMVLATRAGLGRLLAASDESPGTPDDGD
ncbi:NAD-binding protein [Actinocatenispora sera]|uniref:NAD-binding protein n=1 Tax=Actinocatenispora sera TaxID=390989 RepID=UPI0033CA7ABE